MSNNELRVTKDCHNIHPENTNNDQIDTCSSGNLLSNTNLTINENTDFRSIHQIQPEIIQDMIEKQTALQREMMGIGNRLETMSRKLIKMSQQ